MGARRADHAEGPGLAGRLHAARPRAAGRRALRVPARWPTRSRRSRATHGEAFYRGELARSDGRALASRTAARTRSRISPRTQADWVTPLAQDYRGFTVHEIPPNGQGIVGADGAGHARALRPRAPTRAIRSRAQHLQIEAMKLAFADAYRYVERPAHDAVSRRRAARPRLPRGARAAHRSAIARRISVPASRRAAAPSTCARPTQAG